MINKKEAWRKFQVSVHLGRFGNKCFVTKNCKRKPRYMVFADDGKPAFSRLIFDACNKHLPLAVKKAWKYNRETFAKNLKGGDKKKCAVCGSEDIAMKRDTIISKDEVKSEYFCSEHMGDAM